MTSQITPSNIDGTFPIAGQDNSSQGFRDNFTNTKNNFQVAYNELSDLQSKVLLKSALSGTAINNDMNNGLLGNVQTQGFREKVYDFGTTSGTKTIDFSLASYFTIQLSNSVSFAFTNIPALGNNVAQYKIRLEIQVLNVAHTVTFPSSVSKNINSIAGANGQTITFTDIGTYTFELSTVDSGITFSLADCSRSRDTIQGGNLTITNTVANVTTAGIIMSVSNTGVGNITATNFFGNIITTGANSAVFAGNVNSGNVITSGYIYGNIGTPIQTVITQVGQLSSVTVVGNATIGNATVSGMFDTCAAVQETGIQHITGFSTGGSTQLYGNVSLAIINGIGTIAAYTVIMPAAPTNGQAVRLVFGNTITSLTHTAGSSTLKGALTTAANTAGGSWYYHTATTTWYRLS